MWYLSSFIFCCRMPLSIHFFEVIVVTTTYLTSLPAPLEPAWLRPFFLFCRVSLTDDPPLDILHRIFAFFFSPFLNISPGGSFPFSPPLVVGFSPGGFTLLFLQCDPLGAFPLFFPILTRRGPLAFFFFLCLIFSQSASMRSSLFTGALVCRLCLRRPAS